MSLIMLQRRTEILRHIVGGKNDKRFAHRARHGRDLIHQLKLPNDSEPLEHPLVVPGKVSGEVVLQVDPLIRRHPGLGCKCLAHIIDESTDFPSATKSTVHKSSRSTESRAGHRI
jgi:hypothetical protein